MSSCILRLSFLLFAVNPDSALVKLFPAFSYLAYSIRTRVFFFFQLEAYFLHLDFVCHLSSRPVISSFASSNEYPRDLFPPPRIWPLPRPFDEKSGRQREAVIQLAKLIFTVASSFLMEQ